jgi:predicted DNA binding CopG/RHH family protein
MSTKQKRWSELNVDELAAATKQFDDPNYNPPALKPTKEQLAQLRRVQRKAAKDRYRVAIALDEDLIEQADQYAAARGITFSDVVSNALRQLMRKKSA